MNFTDKDLIHLGINFVKNTGKYPAAKQWTITTCGCSRDRIYENFGKWHLFIAELSKYVTLPPIRPVKIKPQKIKRVSNYANSPENAEEHSKFYWVDKYFIDIIDKHPLLTLVYLALVSQEPNLYKYLQTNSQYPVNMTTTILKTYFPSSRNVLNHILDSYDKKYCKHCDKVLDKELYNKNSNKLDGLQDKCKYCRYAYYKDNPEIQRNIVNERRSRTSTPLSAIYREELQKIYRNCPVGNQVDHIIPLLHYEVCGLHVPWNLQYLPVAENASKSNKFISEWLQ